MGPACGACVIMPGGCLCYVSTVQYMHTSMRVAYSSPSTDTPILLKSRALQSDVKIDRL